MPNTKTVKVSNHTYTIETDAWTEEFRGNLQDYALEVILQRSAASDKTDDARHRTRLAKAASLGRGEWTMKGAVDVVGKALTAYFTHGLPAARHAEIPELVDRYRACPEKDIPAQIRASIMSIRSAGSIDLGTLKL